MKQDNQVKEHDSRRLWHGLQAITSSKGGMKFVDNSHKNLSDNLNDLCTRFDKANTDSHFNIQTVNNITHAFAKPEVSKILRKRRARSADSANGIPVRVIKTCASQIPDRFIEISATPVTGRMIIFILLSMLGCNTNPKPILILNVFVCL